MTHKSIKILILVLSSFLILIGCSSQSPQTIEDTTSIFVEFWYLFSEADEVTLVWGVNGWGRLPQEEMPPGTEVIEGLMHTGMAREDDKFTVRLAVPAWITIEYGFLISNSNGESASEAIWDGSESYQFQMAEQNEIIEVAPAISESHAGDSALLGEDESISHEFRYRMPEAGEVYLIWGVDGWGILPESVRPNGTEVVDNLMRTPMVKEGDTFSVVIRAPLNAKVDYGFLVTKTKDGIEIQPVWEGKEDFYIDINTQDDVIEVDSGITLENAMVSEDSDVSSFESLQILYHLPGAGSVELVWGIDGWKAMTEDQLPSDTKLVNGLMHTQMERNGDEFQTEIHFPSNSLVDYGFLVTSTKEGEQVEIWEAKKDQGYSETMNSDGVLVVKSGVMFPVRQGLFNMRYLIIALYLVIGILIVFLVGYIFEYKL
jgi:hypothetical protein